MHSHTHPAPTGHTLATHHPPCVHMCTHTHTHTHCIVLCLAVSLSLCYCPPPSHPHPQAQPTYTHPCRPHDTHMAPRGTCTSYTHNTLIPTHTHSPTHHPRSTCACHRHTTHCPPPHTHCVCSCPSFSFPLSSSLYPFPPLLPPSQDRLPLRWVCLLLIHRWHEDCYSLTCHACNLGQRGGQTSLVC